MSSESYSYGHSFDRTFELEGQKVDRLESIVKYGIVSPIKAKELGISYKSLPISVAGIPDYLDRVFLYSSDRRRTVLGPGSITLLFDDSLSVITPTEARKQISPYWVVASPGEVYVRGIIPLETVKAIRTHSPQDADDFTELIQIHRPELQGRIEVQHEL
ncbi:MAG TPA: hypothetical protein VG917_05765 [Patescibacteria group bacterium]|nr:hypothetical protein [Patescibacteria group bacterium]